MSSRARVVVFYGICYKPESPDVYLIVSGSAQTRGSPTWLMCNARKSHDGVEVVQYGHYDAYQGFALAVADMVSYGDGWEPLALADRVNEDCTHPVENATLRAFCSRHELTWSEPRWWAVPYYG